MVPTKSGCPMFALSAAKDDHGVTLPVCIDKELKSNTSQASLSRRPQNLVPATSPGLSGSARLKSVKTPYLGRNGTRCLYGAPSAVTL